MRCRSERSRFADEASARTALEDGEVSAVLLFPAEFSRSVMSPGAVEIRLIASQHLSLAETQFTGSLSRQIAASLSAAIAGVRLASANGQFPPGDGAEFALPPGADVSVEFLHVAREPAALAATFVMTFATWIAAFVGALLAFLATRAVKGPETILPVSALRSVLPVIVSAIASLSLAIVVAWTTANWPSFIEIWLLVWLATAAITLLIAGLFARSSASLQSFSPCRPSSTNRRCRAPRYLSARLRAGFRISLRRCRSINSAPDTAL